MTASDFIPGKQPDKCPPNSLVATDKGVSGDSPVATSLIAYMIEHGASMTTTPAVYELFYQNRPVQDPRVLDLMAPEVRTAYVAERTQIDTTTNWPLTAEGFARSLAFDLAFYKAGGVLASGVDPTGNGGALPGLGDQRGYEILIEGKFTPEQAVQVAELGPSAPNRIETWPAARLMMAEGMKNGETRSAPRSRNTRCCSAIVAIPPIAEPTRIPTLAGSYSATPAALHAS